MVTPGQHRAAAEQQPADADGHTQPAIPLLRALTHALLALTDERPPSGEP